MKKIAEFTTTPAAIHRVWGDSFELRQKFSGEMKLKVFNEYGQSFIICSPKKSRYLPNEVQVYSHKGQNLRVEVYVEEVEDLDKYEFNLEVSIYKKLK